MRVELESLVSITEANQNFSKVAKLVDANGMAVIMKNNRPRYVVMEYSRLQQQTIAEDDEVFQAGRKIINRNRKAFEELSK